MNTCFDIPLFSRKQLGLLTLGFALFGCSGADSPSSDESLGTTRQAVRVFDDGGKEVDQPDNATKVVLNQRIGRSSQVRK